MINSSEKCCSPFTCSSLSTVEGGGVLPGEGREERGEGEGKRREGGVRDGEERKGLSPKGHNYIHSAKASAPSYDKHV